MSVQGQIHVGDIGTVFRATITDQDGNVVNLSSATAMEILFRRPDRTGFARAAAFATNGSDGAIQYTTVAGDLSEAGPWSIQGHVILPGGEWRTVVEDFRVWENILVS